MISCLRAGQAPRGCAFAWGDRPQAPHALGPCGWARARLSRGLNAPCHSCREPSFSRPHDQWPAVPFSCCFFLAPRATWHETSPAKKKSWQVGAVVSTSRMLAKAFERNVDGWQVDAVVDACKTFSGAASFNQPLNSWQTGRRPEAAGNRPWAKSSNVRSPSTKTSTAGKSAR